MYVCMYVSMHSVKTATDSKGSCASWGKIAFVVPGLVA